MVGVTDRREVMEPVVEQRDKGPLAAETDARFPLDLTGSGKVGDGKAGRMKPFCAPAMAFAKPSPPLFCRSRLFCAASVKRVSIFGRFGGCVF